MTRKKGSHSCSNGKLPANTDIGGSSIFFHDILKTVRSSALLNIIVQPMSDDDAYDITPTHQAMAFTFLPRYFWIGTNDERVNEMSF
jgi:hypothetical protein